MTPIDLFRSAHVWIVAGKGGVGKTTVTATLARAASNLGLSVLVIDLDGAGELARLLAPFDVDNADPASGPIRTQTIAPDVALVDYLTDRGLGRLARTMADTGVVDVITRGMPGIKDILVLGKVKQLERSRAADVILVDAPASGHAISFLRAAAGLIDAVRFGPIHQQAQEVLELLGDPARCQVILVTLPEETPVNELIETAYALEEDIGIKLGPVIVNALYPTACLPEDVSEALVAAGLDPTSEQAIGLAAAAQFRRRRQALQRRETARLADSLPLRQLKLGYRFSNTIGPEDINFLADALTVELQS